MRFAFGVDHSLDNFHKAFKRDRLIGPIIRRTPWARPLRRPEPFEALAWAITEQLIEGERAEEIQRRMVWRYGRRGDGGLRDAPASCPPASSPTSSSAAGCCAWAAARPSRRSASSSLLTPRSRAWRASTCCVGAVSCSPRDPPCKTASRLEGKQAARRKPGGWRVSDLRCAEGCAGGAAWAERDARAAVCACRSRRR